ncbi:hypothetical protein ABKW25_20675 (plasmid) [Enterobacter hormaechei]|jgi:cytochrome c5|uniref:hypothetical protein n=1 Tax=Enterobacterales TaxID=91347 RepID=UPI0006507B93|nr:MULTISPECIES: hypothetical protein [Enterobacter cloacae complex]EIT7321847.1 hypothetical protein [Enterobacter hormaechei]HCR1943846.1 hypothetical protein [Enterobacter kobei]KLW34526.1 hypothetical protein SK53_04392 [Enterobacter sp. MGH119]WNI98563.1 hypothetical protein RIK67_01065 [Enterobacter ludwigii]WNJ07488.1 hypothetical protein RIK62_23630 [Enterobacter ludwigii]
MKKLLFAALFGFSCVAAAAPQPVIDTDAVAQLTEIRNILLTNQQKAYACSDGEKLYTVGLQIKHDGSEYKCVLKNDHAEWEVVPRIAFN